MTYRDYLQLGFPVFPVGHDKKPLVRWKDFQSRFPTEKEISDWEKKFPNAGIGCVTGPFSKLFVIDVDGNKGMKTQATLNYPLPPTRISKTPRGYHYFFKWDERMEKYITTISDIQPGIDIRGKGGYVIVPSRNILDREWKLQDALADLPEKWYDLIPHASTNGKEPLNLADRIAGLAEGNRHDFFLRIIGKLMSAKLEAPEIIATLMPLAVEHHFEQELLDLVTDMFQRYQVIPKTSFHLELIEEFLSKPEPVLSWMIEGLWTSSAKGMLVGQPNLGKTWVALDMLISFVSGLPCLGRFMPQDSGPALLIEQEGSLTNLSRRFHMLAKGRNLHPGSLKHLHHMSFQFPKLPDNEKDIISLMKKQGIKFVVFDSLVRFHNKDENSSTDMRLILDSFTRINMETGASVLLIHHLAKQSTELKRGIWDRVRGTSDFVAWRDCMLGLEGDEGDDLVQCSFQFRDAENPGPIQIQRTLDERTGGMSMLVLDLENTEDFKDKLSKVHEIITSNFGSASKDLIAKKMGGHRSETWKFIKLLESKKLIAKNGSEWSVPN